MKLLASQSSAGVEEILFKELDLSPAHLAKGALGQLQHFARLTFVVGPQVLLTSRISKQCAALMASLSLPALFLTALVVLPQMIFTDPEQNTYFYFARAFQIDSAMVLVMLLMVACTLLALMLPAVQAPPRPENEQDEEDALA